MQAHLRMSSGPRAPPLLTRSFEALTTPIASLDIAGNIVKHDAVKKLLLYDPTFHEQSHQLLNKFGVPVWVQEFLVHSTDFVGLLNRLLSTLLQPWLVVSRTVRTVRAAALILLRERRVKQAGDPATQQPAAQQQNIYPGWDDFVRQHTIERLPDVRGNHLRVAEIIAHELPAALYTIKTMLAVRDHLDGMGKGNTDRLRGTQAGGDTDGGVDPIRSEWSYRHMGHHADRSDSQ